MNTKSINENNFFLLCFLRPLLSIKNIVCSVTILAFTLVTQNGMAAESVITPNLVIAPGDITILSTNGSNRGTSYSMSNKIITANGKIFVSWLDHSSIRIRTYNIESGTWDTSVGLGNWWDNHGGPAITMDSDGYIHAIFGSHSTPLRFRTSTNPYDATSWEMETEGDGVSDALELLIYKNTFVYMTETGLFTDNDRDSRVDIVEFLLYADLDTFDDRDHDGVIDDIETLLYGTLSINMNDTGLLIDDDNDGIADLVKFILCDKLGVFEDSEPDNVIDEFEIALYGNLDVDMRTMRFLTDSNGNGIADVVEFILYGNLATIDTDNDGMADHIETALYGNLDVDMRTMRFLTDNNTDGIADIVKFLLYNDPAFDVDNDGMIDDIERALYGSIEAVNTYPDGVLTDSDGDDNNNIPDILEILLNGNLASDTIDDSDADGDGVSDTLELLMYATTGVDMRPEGLFKDVWREGIADIVECLLYGRIMTLDTDGDNVIDEIEMLFYGTLNINMRLDRLFTDTNGDGTADFVKFILCNKLGVFEDTEPDGVIDEFEIALYGNLDVDMREDGLFTDNNGDGIADVVESILYGDLDTSDTDDDGVIDEFEIAFYDNLDIDMIALGLLTDNDSDSIADIYEFLLFGDLITFNGTQDIDNDGAGDGVIDDYERALYGHTDVDMSADGILTDSDGDSIADILEILLNGNLDSLTLDPEDLIDNDEILVGVQATYPSIVCDSQGTLHLTYRSSDLDPRTDDPFGLIYRRKEKGGAWTYPVALVWPGGSKSYTQYANPIIVSTDGTLHVAFHILYDQGQRIIAGLGYIRSTDGGQTWENVDGVQMTLPITPSDTDCFIYPGPYHTSVRVNNLAVDNQGRVYVSVYSSPSDPAGGGHVIWYHDGSGWEANALLPHVQAIYPQARLYLEQSHGSVSTGGGGSVLYAASGGRSGETGDPKGVFLLASTDQGRTFQVIFTPTNKGFGLYGMNIERPYGETPLTGVPSVIYHTSRSSGDAEIIFLRFTGDQHFQLPGDVNDDELVNLTDAILVAQSVAGIPVILANPQAADVDGSGTVTLKDAMLIAQYVNEVIAEFPE